MRKLLPLLVLLTACAGSQPAKDTTVPTAVADANSEAAVKEMCVEENVGLFRFARAYLEEYCPKLKTQTELTCFRFTHATKDWHKACPGIDTADKLECISTITNGPSYAVQESLEKCRNVKNRKQVYCLSKLIAKTGVPLQPETVQECLEKNP